MVSAYTGGPIKFCTLPLNKSPLNPVIAMSTLYTLDNPRDASRDYLATGDLGPILHVGGGRMRRDLTLNGYYAGSLYVESSALIGLESATIKRRVETYFSLATYERNHRNRDYTASGSGGGCALVPHDPTNGRPLNDHELWNQAAAILHQESDRLTLRYSNPKDHFIKGRWRCGYVGNSGRDTVWRDCQTISHGLLASNPSSRAHFVARDHSGAAYRLVAEWQILPDTMGQRVGLKVAAIHLGGPTAKLPRYLLNWVKSRIAGGTL